MVLSHVQAFARLTAQGAIAALDARLTDPAALVAGAAATLDFREPVAILLPSTLMFVPSLRRVTGIVSALLAALCPGSYLALCHVASDLDRALAVSAEYWNQASSPYVTLRSRAEVAGLVSGLDVVEPGLVAVNEWRPAPGEAPPGQPVPVHAVVARKRPAPAVP